MQEKRIIFHLVITGKHRAFSGLHTSDCSIRSVSESGSRQSENVSAVEGSSETLSRLYHKQGEMEKCSEEPYTLRSLKTSTIKHMS